MAEFDLAVIGAGAAGLSVTAVAAQLGLRVALIERARMGGDCLNTGCVPSKALLAASHAVRAGLRAGRLGVRFAAPKIDWDAVQAHVAGVISEIAPMDSAARFEALGATVIAGEARFVGRDAVMVGDRWAHLVETTVDSYLAARCVSVDPPLPGDGGRQVRVSDGRQVRADPSIGPYTTGAILAQEEHLLTWALDRTPTTPAPSSSTPRDLTNGTRLDSSQHAAAAAVAGHDPLVLVVGPAGTGKTSTLAAAVTDLRTQRRPVFGIAPSNQAAHVLAAETGMATDSVAKLLYEHSRPDRPAGDRWQLPSGATVVVDEAGMLGTGDLHHLSVLADRYRWRLVLVGDPYQLPAIGRGGMFAELGHHTHPIELERVRRFVSEWEGPASLALRRADPGVIGTYDHHQRIRPGSFDDHAAAITREWLDHTSHGRTIAVTAATNDEVDRLNLSIQAARVDLGQLDPALAAGGGGGDRLHPGDVVATRANRRDLTTDRGVMVKNRAAWTITHTRPDGQVTLVGADGTITVPADYVREHVRLAYAATVYGTQGATVDRSITLVSGATDHRNLYVGATRGRHVNDLYVIADSPDDARDTLEAALVRDRVDTPAVAVRRDLLHDVGMGAGATVRKESRAPTPGTHRGAVGAGSIPRQAGDHDRTRHEPGPHGSGPFEGLETVSQALTRLQTERAARHAPRHAYQTLQRELADLQTERARLDRPWQPYERSPLDQVDIARHNARVTVNDLTARLEHAPWRDRRHVRRLLADATSRHEQAEAVYRERYQHEVGRLQPLIAAATARLDQAHPPEPVGARDEQLAQGIGWLRWEVSIGNRDRPTLHALHQRADDLDQVVTGRPLTPNEQAIHHTIGHELDRRQGQREHVLQAQQQREVVERVRTIGRDHGGPELGL